VDASRALIADLAGAILDGTPIDWPAVEASADDTNRPLLDELKLLASVAHLHRQFAVPSPATSLSATLSLDQPDLDQPDHWGHLRLLEPIGSGAFGRVYRAWDTRLEREVALKLLRARSADARATWVIEEGKLLARVRHPNVVTIYGAEQIGGLVGLWMEYVKGRTLNQALQQGMSFSDDQAATICAELARAVAAVHQAGLLHRDIKAHNVMLADDGRVVLMDFGTGHEMGDATHARLAGTPLYLAPELLRDEPASVHSDVYSLGVLLFYLLAGSYPVCARGVQDLRVAHEQGRRTNIRSIRPNLRPRLARIVDRAMDPDPERRYPTADALAADLSSLTSRSRRKAAGYAMAVVVALILVVWLAVEVRSWSAGRPSPTRLLLAGSVPWLPARLATASPIEQPVIAVQPFTNLSREHDTDLIVDGLTSEIVRHLYQIDGLQVKGWESSLAVRNQSLADVGDRLGANLVLHGDVLWAGNRVRVNPRLVQVAGNVLLWSDRFEGELKDVFAIQDDIARAIVNRLQLKLGKGHRRYNTNPQAYELYLRARALTGRGGLEGPQKAVGLFKQVIAIDAGFAPAHAGLVNSYAFLSMQPYQGVSYKDALATMRAAASKAVELDPRAAEAHEAMGWVHSREFDWGAAERSFQHAISLNSSLTSLYTNYSFSTLRPLGKFDEAERQLLAAMQHDPLSVYAQHGMGQLYLSTGRYNEAIAIFERLRSVDAELPFLKRDLGRALVFAHRADEAIPLLDDVRSPHYLAYAYVGVGRRSEAEKLYAEHERYPYRKAVISAALGNKDRTFEALDEMMRDEPHRVANALAYPEFALLRGDPRLAALRRSLGLGR
jgi:eukaryotic-like serine/threonine-protein kinase